MTRPFHCRCDGRMKARLYHCVCTQHGDEHNYGTQRFTEDELKALERAMRLGVVQRRCAFGTGTILFVAVPESGQVA